MMSHGRESLEEVDVLAIATTASRVGEALVQNSLVVIKDAKGSVRTYWMGKRIPALFKEGKLWVQDANGQPLCDLPGKFSELFDFASANPSFNGTKLRAVQQYEPEERRVQHDARADRLLAL